jgi:hypothetical protein
MQFDDRETAVILAALRNLQTTLGKQGTPENLDDILGEYTFDNLLDFIDELCERIETEQHVSDDDCRSFGCKERFK